MHDNTFSELLMELAKLKDYGELRNIIVHKNGSIKQEDISTKNRIKKIIQNEENIKIDGAENLELSKEFVESYISFLKKTGEQIFASLSI